MSSKQLRPIMFRIFNHFRHSPPKPAGNVCPILVILTLLRFSAHLVGVSPP